MGTKKDIGKAFKERLHEFKDSPNNTVWENIEAELKKENNDKFIFPLWGKIGGIALILLLLMFTINTFTTNTNSEININTNNESIITKKETLNTTDYNIKTDLKTIKKTKSPESTSPKFIKSKYNNKQSINSLSITKNLKDKANKYQKEIFNNSENNSNPKDSISNNSLLSNKLTKTKNQENTLVENLETNKNTNNLIEEKTPKKETTKDSIEQESKAKWSVSIIAIPTYYGSLAKGSSLDNNYKNYSKSNPFSLNYGAFLNYHISEKNIIRIGILKSFLNYTTNNISTINTNGNIISVYKISALNPNTSIINNDEFTSFLNSNNSISLTQTINYTEIPLEIKHIFNNNKIAPNVILGLSYLSLNSNKIESFSNNTRIFKIGEANNLNKTNFSLNLGGGFKYNIGKKINLNFDTLFKYHLTPYNKNYGNFKPYTLSLQVGLSYDLNN